MARRIVHIAAGDTTARGAAHNWDPASAEGEFRRVDSEVVAAVAAREIPREEADYGTAVDLLENFGMGVDGGDAPGVGGIVAAVDFDDDGLRGWDLDGIVEHEVQSFDDKAVASGVVAVVANAAEALGRDNLDGCIGENAAVAVEEPENKWKINQSIHQFIHQSINQSIDQSNIWTINQSINLWVIWPNYENPVS